MKIDKKYNVLIMTRTKIRIYDKRTRRQKDVLMERIDDKFDHRYKHQERLNRKVLQSLANRFDNSYEVIYNIDEDKHGMHQNKEIIIKKGNLDFAVNLDRERDGTINCRFYKRYGDNLEYFIADHFQQVPHTKDVGIAIEEYVEQQANNQNAEHHIAINGR